MDNFIFYIFALAILIIVFMLIKKLAGCIIKTVIMLVVAAILTFVYFQFIR